MAGPATTEVSVAVAASATSAARFVFICSSYHGRSTSPGVWASRLAIGSQERQLCRRPPRNRLARASNPPSNDHEAWLAGGETSESESIRFRILGALEAEVGDRALELGGGKQRAVLAALLLRADEVVPGERLVDEIWGDSPPPSAAHSLEVYVSRLRQALAPHGVSLQRGGGGYRLGLGEAVLDSQVFEGLVEEASKAAATGDDGRAAALATQALGLWDGPVVAGVALHMDGRADAERLDELRSRALEIRVDAELAL